VPVAGVDHGVTIVGLDNKGPEHSVNEANLPNGTDPNADALTVKGSFNIDAKDGLSSLTIDGVQIISNDALVGTSVVGQDGNTLTITGYDAATQTLSYSYTLSEAQQNLGKADQALYEDFKVVATDPQGQSDLAWLNVQIVDDAPIAKPDFATVSDHNTRISGSVLTNDLIGADSNERPVTAQSNVQGIYGTLNLNSDGTYTYALNTDSAAYKAIVPGQHAEEHFQYQITDGDGDSATSWLNIQVNNLVDPITLNIAQDTLTVQESALPGGSHENSDGRTVDSTFKVEAADGVQNLTVGGVEVVKNGQVVIDQNGASAKTDHGTFTVTGYSDGTVYYKYTLEKAADHAAGQGANTLDDNISIAAESRGGEKTTGELHMRIVDDVPSASHDAPTLDVQNAGTNLMLVLDTSNSMNGPSKVGDLSRLDFAKQAIDTLIGQYSDLGDVRVQIVTFNTYANQLESHWMTADQARAALNDITASGGTNYDYALDKASSAWSAPGALASGQNVSYFLSDGNPTLSDQQPLPVTGVQNGRETEPGVGDGISAAEAQSWEGFLRDHNIKSYAIGMGPSLDTQYLDPIAYDGVRGQNTDAQWARNLSDLPDALAGTVTSAPVSGSLVGEGGFGADGGHVSTLSVDGVTWTYAPANGRELGSVQASDPNAKYSFNPASGELTISTAHSGELTVNLNTGAYQYALQNGNAGGYRENITFTLEDNDRDTASSSLVVNVKAAAEADFTATSVNRLRVLDDARAIERSDFHANTAILLATVLVAGTLGTAENGRLSDALTVSLRKGETLDVSQQDGKKVSVSWADSDGVYHALGKDGFTADHDGQYHIKVTEAPAVAARGQDSDYSLKLGLHYGQPQVETHALQVTHAEVQTAEHTSHARVAVAHASEQAVAENTPAKEAAGKADHQNLGTLLGDEHEQPLFGSDQAQPQDGKGHEVVVAGAGHEVLSGGAGANTFAWEPGSNGHDVVTNFKPGVDTLDLSQLLGDVAKNGSLDDFFKVTQTGKGDDVSSTLIVGKGSNAQSIELDHVNLAEQYHASTQADGNHGLVVSAHDVINGLLGDHSLKVEAS
ncbi:MULTISPECIES: VWA domain-containing protein, partial [unclassified Pseudomonas]|uniref:VWA domain-containing protein n=2 Tax=unclassified Pseudomonas TaxID=196821 RepID=UPI000D5D7F22